MSFINRDTLLCRSSGPADIQAGMLVRLGSDSGGDVPTVIAATSQTTVLGVALDFAPLAGGFSTRVVIGDGEIVFIKVKAGTYAAGTGIALSPLTNGYGTAVLLTNQAFVAQSLTAVTAAEGDLIPCILRRFGGVYTDTPIGSGLSTELASPTWIAASYQNGYVDFGGSYAGTPSGYHKDATGRVHVRVSAKSGTAAAAIFTLPAGYRPAGQLIVSAYVDTSVLPQGNFVNISAAGVVNAVVGGTTSVFCHSCSFPAEA